jgi:hypothetical protein
LIVNEDQTEPGQVIDWIAGNGIRVLNVAGNGRRRAPRASPGHRRPPKPGFVRLERSRRPRPGTGDRGGRPALAPRRSPTGLLQWSRPSISIWSRASRIDPAMYRGAGARRPGWSRASG